MLSENHQHTYIRVKGKKGNYMCSHPDCSHVRNRELLVGKRAQCPFCTHTFILDRVQLRNKHPRCEDCRRKGSPKGLSMNDILKGLIQDNG